MRLIDADELKKAIYKRSYYIDDYEEAIKIIDNAPTVEEVSIIEFKEPLPPVKAQKIIRALNNRPQGEWIFRSGVTCGGYYKCSICGEVERAEKNYCPNCGADMRGNEE